MGKDTPMEEAVSRSQQLVVEYLEKRLGKSELDEECKVEEGEEAPGTCCNPFVQASRVVSHH